MNKEDFRILKELCGLHSTKIAVTAKIDAEMARITKIENLREDAREALASAQKELISVEEETQNIESQTLALSQKIEQSTRAVDNATSEKQVSSAESQLKIQKDELSKLEEQGFVLLERFDEISALISEKETFIEGSAKTLRDISDEVEKECTPLRNEIDILNSRIANLSSELPADALTRVSKLLDKNLKHGPLTKLEGDSCYICRFTMGAVDKEKIEKNLSLKSCSSCTRIFIPNSTLY